MFSKYWLATLLCVFLSLTRENFIERPHSNVVIFRYRRTVLLFCLPLKNYFLSLFECFIFYLLACILVDLHKAYLKLT